MRTLAALSNLILAKLLAPEVFGIIAIANVVIGAMELFSDVGVGKALIQYQGDAKKAAKVAFTLRIGQGLFLFLLAFALSGTIADYLQTEVLRSIIRVLGINFLIQSIGAVPMCLLSRDLKFKQQVIPNVLPALLQTTTAITLAILGFGVWSIVWGMALFTLTQSLLYWSASPIKLGFRFDSRIAGKLLGFGLPLFASGIALFAVYNVDKSVVGKLLGMKELGYYAFAFTIINLPTTEIVYLINRVMFPTYSQLGGRLWDLKNAYLKTLRYIALITLPLSIGIPLFGGDLFKALYGDKWIPAVGPLQAFGVFAFMRSFGATTGSIFMALGKTRHLLYNILINLVLVSFFVYPAAVYFGVTGVAVLYSIVWTIGTFILLIWLRWLIQIKPGEIFRDLRTPLIASLLTMLPVKFIFGRYIPLSNLAVLSLASAAIVIVYIAIVARLDQNAALSLRESWKQRKIVLF